MRVANTYLVSSKTRMYALLLLNMFQFCQHIRNFYVVATCSVPNMQKYLMSPSLFFGPRLSYRALSIIKSNYTHNNNCSLPICYISIAVTCFTALQFLIKSAVSIFQKRFKSLRPKVASLKRFPLKHFMHYHSDTR